MQKNKRKNDQPDPSCLLPLVLAGMVLFGTLAGYEIFLWIERGL